MTTTQSLWQDTRTFFPIFLDLVETRRLRSACVVGASDGKFVLPLARRGVHVVAIEPDPTALDGGPGTLPGSARTTMPGLRKRLAAEALTDRVQVVQADVRAVVEQVDPVEAVWTSCSWHYSINHDRPLEDFITAMSRLCRPRGGLLGAEYMMPVEPCHFQIEHYAAENYMRRYFAGWTIEWETYTPPFVEQPHLGQPVEHVHRMGLIIATRP